MPALAAIQYAQDAFDTRVGEMMGRRMASENFLRAWATFSGADPLTAWVHTRPDAEAFQSQVRALGVAGPIAIAGVENWKPLLDAGTLWLADPAIQRHAWERRWTNQNAWSIVGITHTIASDRAIDHIVNLLTSPVQPWDALICTSQAVKKAVQTLLQEQALYLSARTGATRCTGPELPVIPLGIPCEDFAPDPATRARWRAELGIAADDVAILQFGRMSFHLKAHPLPLYLALRQAAARGGPNLHLILAGQPTNPHQGDMFRTLAADFAASVTTHFVDGARADAKSVHSAADIFTLLSDNIQESFGLAPVEAMAAALPVVGSDWDGLRDTIVHGVTGFLIASAFPDDGAGAIIARRYALGQDDYHHYVGGIAQATAIDIGKAAHAFAALAADPALRRRMGAAGRARALALYDWPKIIAAYVGLIDNLAKVRATAQERAPCVGERAPHPARMDPFRLFGSYPTDKLKGSDRLVTTGIALRMDELPGGFDIAVVNRPSVPSLSILDGMLALVAAGQITVIDLVAAFPDVERRSMASGVAFLMKMGLIARA
jgi:glycosyltransferase involved in cell wall biosynthesis